eukprot:TRINITY_DN8932_c0_g1_i1.p1 TRINITY_DN8932_c0_g1~~TRINITY_DN8932_c0_g1_i1.p1  ORF type:complete len:315 (+),score=86.19 TRINITY_DN8932_c0_g1_i1:1001-1945(+)
MAKLLVSGLGGGLDVVNASLLFYAAQAQSIPVILGSVRPDAQSKFRGPHQPFADSGTLVGPETSIDVSRDRHGSTHRYAEFHMARLTGSPVAFFSRRYSNGRDLPRLADAVQKAESALGVSAFVFVDGGGDSLILRPTDVGDTSESADPYKGGDAEIMHALLHCHTDAPVYQAVIAMGLDVGPEAFHNNVAMLKERGGYFGRVNLKTGEEDGYTLGHLLSFGSNFVDAYFKAAESVLVLTEADLTNSQKVKSHTATVVYHALKGNYGLRRTFVPWEPNIDGTPGVVVKPEHCWMYFFDMRAIERLKNELNGRPI